MLRNYSLLRGSLTKDLEDHIKHRETHYNLLVSAGDSQYQVNIDLQSSVVPNVKMVFIANFDHKLLSCLDKLGSEGLFTLNERTTDDRLDYLRSNLVPWQDFKTIQPKSWQEISNLLDQHLKIGAEIYCLGEYYDDQQVRTELPHGLMLQQIYPDMPPRGIHNIHFNQGTPLNMLQSKSNGIYQDGVMFIKANDNSINAFCFMFDCQSLATDSSGNPV